MQNNARIRNKLGDFHYVFLTCKLTENSLKQNAIVKGKDWGRHFYVPIKGFADLIIRLEWYCGLMQFCMNDNEKIRTIWVETQKSRFQLPHQISKINHVGKTKKCLKKLLGTNMFWLHRVELITNATWEVLPLFLKIFLRIVLVIHGKRTGKKMLAILIPAARPLCRWLYRDVLK